VVLEGCRAYEARPLSADAGANTLFLRRTRCAISRQGLLEFYHEQRPDKQSRTGLVPVLTGLTFDTRRYKVRRHGVGAFLTWRELQATRVKLHNLDEVEPSSPTLRRDPFNDREMQRIEREPDPSVWNKSAALRWVGGHSGVPHPRNIHDVTLC